jgi:hypothetical protein
MNNYQIKRSLRIERLEDAADRLENQSNQLYSQAKDMASIIPFGQPILIGHHSEGRDRRYRGRIMGKFEKAFELSKQAKELAGRAAAAASNTAISSDDPEAVTLLLAKIEKAEAVQAKMVAFNKAMRKKDNPAMLALGFSQTQIDKLLLPDCCGRFGFADYQLSNNKANISRMKKRVEALSVQATREHKEHEINGVRVVENTEDNRIQIIFDGKPPEATRALLKSNGFRWSPMAGAWQRQLNNNGIHAARYVLEKLKQVD